LKRHSGEKIALQPKQQVHELISAQIILEDPHLTGLILDSDRKKIVQLLAGEYGYTLFKDIVSGPVDVDKQDYLLRDSYFCGVKYGIFDIDRLLNSVAVHDDGEDRFLAISKDGVHVLEQFVLAKYYMTTQVYFHRIRLITDEMIGRAISLGIDVDGVDWLKTLYSYDGSLDYVKEYLEWNDERLTVKILEESRDTYVRSIFEMLTKRRLLKCIFDFSEKDFSDPLAKLLVFAGSDGFHTRLQELIADRWKFDRNLVICNRVTFKSPVKTESEISVLYPGKTRYFSEESIIFSTVNRAINEQRFQVYAPTEYKDERDKKRQVREFEAEISDMIHSIANAEPQGATTGGNE